MRSPLKASELRQIARGLPCNYEPFCWSLSYCLSSLSWTCHCSADFSHEGGAMFVFRGGKAAAYWRKSAKILKDLIVNVRLTRHKVPAIFRGKWSAKSNAILNFLTFRKHLSEFTRGGEICGFFGALSGKFPTAADWSYLAKATAARIPSTGNWNIRLTCFLLLHTSLTRSFDSKNKNKNLIPGKSGTQSGSSQEKMKDIKRY